MQWLNYLFAIPFLLFGLLGIVTNVVCVGTRASLVPLIPTAAWLIGSFFLFGPLSVTQAWRFGLIGIVVDPANWEIAREAIAIRRQRDVPQLARATLLVRRRRDAGAT
jgi:hypothetical protein